MPTQPLRAPEQHLEVGGTRASSTFSWHLSSPSSLSGGEGEGQRQSDREGRIAATKCGRNCSTIHWCPKYLRCLQSFL